MSALNDDSLSPSRWCDHESKWCLLLIWGTNHVTVPSTSHINVSLNTATFWRKWNVSILLICQKTILSIRKKLKMVITVRTPLTNALRVSSFKSNLFLFLLSATQGYEPGAARWCVGTGWGCDRAWSPPSPPLRLLAYYTQLCLLDHRADKD